MSCDFYVFCESTKTDPHLFLQMAGLASCARKGKTAKSPSQGTVFQYVTEGEGCMEFDSYSYQAGKGDVLIVPRGGADLWPKSCKKPWQRILVMLQGDLIENLLRTYGLQSTNHVPECGDLEKCFRSILDLAKKMKTDPELCHQERHRKLSMYAFELVYGIYLHTKSTTPEYSADVAKLRELIDERFEHTNVDIRELGQHIGKSVSQIIRVFKKEVGVTPYEYYLTRKTEAAKLLIENTNSSIKEIAYRLKFSDEHYFSNVFKARTGHPPSFFRKGT